MRTKMRYCFLLLASLLMPLCAWTQFTGGSGDGSVRIFLASSINCGSFFGSLADGHSNAVLANPDPCNNFDGGLADGAARALLVSPDSCGMFEGGQRDGYGNSTFFSPIPCTAFFASQRDGHALAFLPCAPLAVVTSELLGEVQGNDGYLWWFTHSETHNLGFIVERSADQLTWAEIGFLPGQASSATTRKYDLWDREMLPGVNYYRWRQVDLNGTATQSNTVALVKPSQAATNLVLYPNPVGQGNFLQLHYESIEASGLTIIIVDAIGHVVETRNRQVTAGAFHDEINTENWSTGVYFLTVHNSRERISRRFVVQ
jgi:hypothetical protein